MIEGKIKKLDVLKNILSDFKKQNKSIVFTNGCFDILHVGHVLYLEDAKREGEILVVAVNSDSSTKRLKGKNRPLVNQNDRMRILASLEAVDFVTVFDEDTPEAIVKELNPDVIVKGSDWKEDEIIGGDFVKRKGGKVVTVPFRKDYSTSSLIKKVKGL